MLGQRVQVCGHVGCAMVGREVLTAGGAVGRCRVCGGGLTEA